MVDPKVISANTRFGFKLFSQLKSHSSENIFISPTSIAIALAMIYNGAKGETQQAMAKMELQGSLPDINAANAAAIAALQKLDQLF